MPFKVRKTVQEQICFSDCDFFSIRKILCVCVWEGGWEGGGGFAINPQPVQNSLQFHTAVLPKKDDSPNNTAYTVKEYCALSLTACEVKEWKQKMLK